MTKNYCKGLCTRISVNRPLGSPYKKGYVMCSSCAAWFKKEDTKNGEGMVCLCCKLRVRMKKRANGLKA